MPRPIPCPACGVNVWVSRRDAGKKTNCTECASEFEIPKTKSSSKSRKRKKKQKQSVASEPSSSDSEKRAEASDSGSGLVDCIVEDWLSNYDIGDNHFSYLYSPDSDGEEDDDIDVIGPEDLNAPKPAESDTAPEPLPAHREKPGIAPAVRDFQPSAVDGQSESSSADPVDEKPAEVAPAEMPVAEAKESKPQPPSDQTTAGSAPQPPMKSGPSAEPGNTASKPSAQSPPELRTGSTPPPPRPAPSRPMTNDPYDRIDPQLIRLMIREISANVVSIEFPAQLLELSGFRASMPMRCIVKPEAPAEELIAKPFPWVDKLRHSNETAKEMANRFARKVPPDMGEQEFVDGLHMIMELPAPFNLQMPFYVSKEEEQGFEPLTQVVSTKYGLGCVVTLPISETVLEWVGRVNGLYSRECYDLSKAVYSRTNQKLMAMPRQTRRRIKEWFECRPEEQFLLFLPDSDFAKKDEGLAGMILTDRRMVFRKYNQRGELSLARSQRLISRQDGPFADIMLQKEDGTTRKLVRLRREGAYLVSLLLENIGTYVTLANEPADG